MSTQTTILVAFAVLFVAGLAVSVSGWILFARDRRALQAAHRWQRPRPGSPGAPDE
jgi:hypothetical protein